MKGTTDYSQVLFVFNIAILISVFNKLILFAGYKNCELHFETKNFSTHSLSMHLCSYCSLRFCTWNYRIFLINFSKETL